MPEMMLAPLRLWVRRLFCPICGVQVDVLVDSEEFPEVHVLPDHLHGAGGNLCAGAVVTVGIDHARCKKCGGKMSKHPTGLCRGCYGAAS